MTLSATRTTQATAVAGDAPAMHWHMRSHPACISAHSPHTPHPHALPPCPWHRPHTGQQGLITMHMMITSHILNPIPLYCVLQGQCHTTSPRSGVRERNKWHTYAGFSVYLTYYLLYAYPFIIMPAGATMSPAGARPTPRGEIKGKSQRNHKDRGGMPW